MRGGGDCLLARLFSCELFKLCERLWHSLTRSSSLVKNLILHPTKRRKHQSPPLNVELKRGNFECKSVHYWGLLRRITGSRVKTCIYYVNLGLCYARYCQTLSWNALSVINIGTFAGFRSLFPYPQKISLEEKQIGKLRGTGTPCDANDNCLSSKVGWSAITVYLPCNVHQRRNGVLVHTFILSVQDSAVKIQCLTIELWHAQGRSQLLKFSQISWVRLGFMKTLSTEPK